MNTSYQLLNYKKQGGFLLVTALGFIVAFSFLVFVVSQKLTEASNAQLFSMLAVQATNAANSGVEEGVYLITKNPQYHHYCETMNLQKLLNEPGLKNCSVTISCSVTSVEKGGASSYLISSQARCGSNSIYSTRTVDAGLLRVWQENDQQQFRIIYRKLK